MLPAATLVRFRCVCRSWKELIRDPVFIKEHMRNRASKGTRYLLHVKLEHSIDRTFRFLNDETFERSLEIRLPLELYWKSFSIVGSCNGLLCLTVAVDFGTTIYLCNPFVRTYKTINPPSEQSNVKFSLGFGYYDVTNDYKIVRIASVMDDDMDSTFQYKVVMASKIEVYSMMTNSWKSIEVDYFPWGWIERKSEALINNSIHWKAVYRSRDEDIAVILAFHMGKEVFYQIDQPDFEADGDDLMEHIGVFKGDLALFAFHLTDNYPWHEKCHLWVMKEYGVVSSWTKLYSIRVDGGVVSPIIFTNNDEIIYENGELELSVCRLDSNAVTPLGVDNQGYLSLVTYVDSLVMLNG
ncbi:hypothetical protein ABFX02_14G080300 [Erythranthe guttata]